MAHIAMILNSCLFHTNHQDFRAILFFFIILKGILLAKKVLSINQMTEGMRTTRFTVKF